MAASSSRSAREVYAPSSIAERRSASRRLRVAASELRKRVRLGRDMRFMTFSSRRLPASTRSTHASNTLDTTNQCIWLMGGNLMDVTSLRWFQQVADGVTVTEVSDLEQVSQSGVSRALARLESELGVALFRRSGRVLRMTQAGATFKRH